MQLEKRINGQLVKQVVYDELEDSQYLTIGTFQPNGLPKLKESGLSAREIAAAKKPIAVF